MCSGNIAFTKFLLVTLKRAVAAAYQLKIKVHQIS